jgi:hypothetical protein
LKEDIERAFTCLQVFGAYSRKPVIPVVHLVILDFCGGPYGVQKVPTLYLFLVRLIPFITSYPIFLDV